MKFKKVFESKFEKSVFGEFYLMNERTEKQSINSIENIWATLKSAALNFRFLQLQLVYRLPSNGFLLYDKHVVNQKT